MQDEAPELSMRSYNWVVRIYPSQFKVGTDTFGGSWSSTYFSLFSP